MPNVKVKNRALSSTEKAAKRPGKVRRTSALKAARAAARLVRVERRKALGKSVDYSAKNARRKGKKR